MLKKKWNALVIDDERLARQDLRSLLVQHENLNVVGEAEDVQTSLKAIKELKPDVIFLDIQMPGESGFDLCEKIDPKTKVIFVTAYDEYAIRAFEVNALDYLLKPVNPDRLARALERLEEEGEVVPMLSRRLKYDDIIFLMVGNHYRFIKIRNLVRIRAAGDYTEIKTGDGEKGLTLKSMKEWSQRLPDQYFLRVHRSTIVNLDFIDRVEKWFNYTFRIYLKGEEERIIMSRRYASQLKSKFS